MLKDWYFSSVVLTGSISFMVWGYTNSISNVVLPFLRIHVFPDQSPFKISLIASIIGLGAALGALISGLMVNNLGRRKTLFLSDLFMIVGVFCTIIENFEFLLIGRLIEGITIGIYSVATPIYTLEMCPKEKIGLGSTLSFFSLNMAQMFAYTLGYLVSDDPTQMKVVWRLAYSLLLIPPVLRILLFSLIFTEDTPTYLVQTGQAERALSELKIYFNSKADEILKELKTDQKQLSSVKKSSINLTDLFSLNYKNALFMGFTVVLLFQFSGLNIMMVFPNEVFAPGIQSKAFVSTLTLMMGLVNTLSKVLAGKLVERFGRREPLVYGMMLTTFTLFLYSVICMFDSPENWFGKILMIFWPVPFSVSVGSLTSLYLAEILPPLGVSVCVQILWLTSFFVVQVFASAKDYLGLEGVFTLFFLICFSGTLYLHKYAIETKGKSKGEIFLEIRRVGGPFRFLELSHEDPLLEKVSFEMKLVKNDSLVMMN